MHQEIQKGDQRRIMFSVGLVVKLFRGSGETWRQNLLLGLNGGTMDGLRPSTEY